MQSHFFPRFGSAHLDETVTRAARASQGEGRVSSLCQRSLRSHRSHRARWTACCRENTIWRNALLRLSRLASFPLLAGLVLTSSSDAATARLSVPITSTRVVSFFSCARTSSPPRRCREQTTNGSRRKPGRRAGSSRQHNATPSIGVAQRNTVIGRRRIAQIPSPPLAERAARGWRRKLLAFLSQAARKALVEGIHPRSPCEYSFEPEARWVEMAWLFRGGGKGSKTAEEVRSVRVNSPTAAGRPPLDWAVLNRQALVRATPSPSRNGQAGRSHRAGRNLGGTAQAARLACAAASEEGVLPGLGGGHRRSGRHAGGQGEGRVAKGCAAPERAVPAREARPDPLALRVAASMDLTDFMLTG